jgi:hypothetical protein
MAAIDHRGRPVDPPGRVEAPQQLRMQRGEHPGGLPLLQPPMRGRRRAAQLARQVLPRDPGEQHEHDRPEAHPVIDTRTTAPRIGLVHRHERLDGPPQLVADLPHRRRHDHLLDGLCLPAEVRRRRLRPSQRRY